MYSLENKTEVCKLFTSNEALATAGRRNLLIVKLMSLSDILLFALPFSLLRTITGKLND